MIPEEPIGYCNTEFPCTALPFSMLIRHSIPRERMSDETATYLLRRWLEDWQHKTQTYFSDTKHTFYRSY